MDALAPILESRREVLNQRFRLARHTFPWIDDTDFLRLLRERLAPIAAALPPEQRVSVVEELYTLLLELMAKKLMGSKAPHPWVEEVWGMLPSAPLLLAEAPRKVVVSLCNAAWNLGIEPAARPERWIKGMRNLAPLCGNAEEWLQVGLVQGWRHGLAWMRNGAVETWKILPDALKLAALEIGDVAIEQVERDLEDPWLKPGKVTGARILKLRMLGGFRGFGGPFLLPPRVEAREGNLYAVSGDVWWAIHADYFGATVRRVTMPVGNVDAFSAWNLQTDGTVTVDGLSEVFPPLRGATSIATTSHTLLAATPRSHKLMVIARMPLEAPVGS